MRPVMRVLALPAFRNRVFNPYTFLLYSAVARAGVSVEEVSRAILLRPGFHVLHLHWPEYAFIAPSMAKAVLKSLTFAVVLSLLRARKIRIVWTIHNLRNHEQWHARLEKRMWRWFVGRVDGYIALSPGGQAAVLERFPVLSERPGFVIPHGHFGDEYPDEVTPEAARAQLSLPPEARVLCFLGAVRPYKNVPDLVRAFRAVSEDDWRLVIAGRPDTEELDALVHHEAAGDGRIRLDLEFVPHDRMQLYLRSADLVALPYRDLLNSGSALLALSFERPILVPGRGVMGELRESVGAEWVRTYAGELEAATLVEAMAWATATPRDPSRVLRGLDWEPIARETVRAYEVVRRAPQAGSRHR